MANLPPAEDRPGLPILRRAFANYATGVAVITAEHPTHGLIGITVNSFSSVSLDPPLILFSLARTSFSLQPLVETPNFVVNVLREGQQDLSHRFARSGTDKWESLPWHRALSGAPVLDGGIAHFDCVHHARYDGGDHVILLGRVNAVGSDADGDPLLYFRSRYRAIRPEDDPA